MGTSYDAGASVSARGYSVGGGATGNMGSPPNGAYGTAGYSSGPSPFGAWAMGCYSFGGRLPYPAIPPDPFVPRPSYPDSPGSPAPNDPTINGSQTVNGKK